MSGQFPILMYHGLSADPSVISITPALFQWQMAWLARAGVRVLPLREVVERLQRRQPLPPRSLAITFDDGLASVYAAAWPILARFGFPATVFLVANYCGQSNAWPGQPAQLKPETMMTWPQVRELDRCGIEIGAHTLDHARLDLLSDEAVRSQVEDGKALIETQLGHAVEFFAYPYGRHSPAVREIVGESFAGACTARPGLIRPGADPLLLDRIDVTYVSRPFLFARLFNPAFPLYAAGRRIMRRAGSRILSRPWA